MRGRFVSILTGGVLVLAACGSPATESSDAVATPVDAADTTTDTATDEPGETATDDASADPATPDDDGATEEPEPAAPADDDGAVGEEATAEAAEPAETTPTTTEAADLRPDDGCSADNSPTEPDVADGPLPTVEVRAAATSSPLPDLAVRRINCAGGWVNLKNEIPADRPLLVWFWAPH